jgi:prepilin-type N-terminal cleavage/methylation domain-containing protein
MVSKSFKQRGYTLIELLVVVSILSLLASIIFTFVANGKTRAVNAQTVAQVKEFQKAVVFSADALTDTVPDTGNTIEIYCAGKSSAQTCNFNGLTKSGNDLLQSAITPVLPQGIAIKPVTIDGKVYDSAMYKCRTREGNKCLEAALYYPLANVSVCNEGTLIFSGSGGVLCGINADGSGTSAVETAVASGASSVTFNFVKFEIKYPAGFVPGAINPLTGQPMEPSTYDLHITYSTSNWTDGSKKKFKLVNSTYPSDSYVYDTLDTYTQPSTITEVHTIPASSWNGGGIVGSC